MTVPVLTDRDRSARHLEAHLLDAHGESVAWRASLAELRQCHDEAHGRGQEAYPHRHESTGDAR